jgi:hypothetical protein
LEIGYPKHMALFGTQGIQNIGLELYVTCNPTGIHYRRNTGIRRERDTKESFQEVGLHVRFSPKFLWISHTI